MNQSGGKAKGEADGVDDDERARLEVAEIMRRMEDRKAAKQLQASRSSRKEKGRVDTVVYVSHGKDKTGISDVARTTDKSVADAQGTTKKGVGRITAMVSHAMQREAARSWAAEESTDGSTVARSTTDKSSTRTKAVKKNMEAKPTVVNETLESIEAQNFIASQYPPVDKGVLSGTRLGRSLVSGALGRCTDDPRMFDAAVGIVECSVVLRTTKVKAKAPVCKPSPNSIDSDAEEDITDDAHLSPSHTDTGVCIELPEGAAEATAILKDAVTEVGGPIYVGTVTDDAPKTPGEVATPGTTGNDKEISVIVRDSQELTGTDKDGCIGRQMVGAPRSVVLSDFNKMMNEIEISALLQEELRKTDPTLASVSSFVVKKS